MTLIPRTFALPLILVINLAHAGGCESFDAFTKGLKGLGGQFS